MAMFGTLWLHAYARAQQHEYGDAHSHQHRLTGGAEADTWALKWTENEMVFHPGTGMEGLILVCVCVCVCMHARASPVLLQYEDVF